MKRVLMKAVDAEIEETAREREKNFKLKWKLIFSHVEWLRLKNKMIFYCALSAGIGFLLANKARYPALTTRL